MDFSCYVQYKQLWDIFHIIIMNKLVNLKCGENKN